MGAVAVRTAGLAAGACAGLSFPAKSPASAAAVTPGPAHAVLMLLMPPGRETAASTSAATTLAVVACKVACVASNRGLLLLPGHVLLPAVAPDAICTYEHSQQPAHTATKSGVRHACQTRPAETAAAVSAFFTAQPVTQTTLQPSQPLSQTTLQFSHSARTSALG